MGRRNKSRRGRGDDDGLEQAEMAWLDRRASSSPNKRRRTENCDGEGATGAKEGVSAPAKFADALTSSDANEGKPTSSSSDADAAKIERLRLKKQRQKERRKEKKAQAAAAAEASQQRRRETEKELQTKQKKEKEKKKRIKDGASQQYTTLVKGVKMQDLIVGKGPVVQHRKKIRVAYTLRAKSHTSGKIIDASRNYGFRLGKGEVISGYDIGLQGMRVGGTRRLIVPPEAGYGNRDVGAGRGADLYFQIELLYVAP